MRAWSVMGGVEITLRSGVAWDNGERMELWAWPVETACEWFEYHDEFLRLAPFRAGT